jgi:adenylate cyclase class 2
MAKTSYEVETKILDVDHGLIISKLAELGAEKIQQTKLVVDWYRPEGIIEGEDPWFLRIRSNSDGINEVTWKAKSQINGVTRQHKEINFNIENAVQLADLFSELGLVQYAHQEKERASFLFQDWRFDLDQYPNMPALLEIEGNSEDHINQIIKQLDLQNHRTWAKGERILIQEVYGLDWYDMKF